MSLLETKNEFDHRHEFGDDDLDILSDRWPNVKFINIPSAWIWVIDEMLCTLRYDNPIKEIRQEFGQLIIMTGKTTLNQAKIIRGTEIKILAIDADLIAEPTGNLS